MQRPGGIFWRGAGEVGGQGLHPGTGAAARIEFAVERGEAAHGQAEASGFSSLGPSLPSSGSALIPSTSLR